MSKPDSVKIVQLLIKYLFLLKRYEIGDPDELSVHSWILQKLMTKSGEMVYGLNCVRGKMWRVLKNIYKKVESCILLGDHRTDFFNLQVGLRQGCILSPI